MKEYTDLISVISGTCMYLESLDEEDAAETSKILAKATTDYAATLKPAAPADSGSLTDKDRLIILMHSILTRNIGKIDITEREAMTLHMLIRYPDV